ncbi:MAG: hypothetical protein K2P50_16120 [Lachnospiraceae bacterium]|nr:hypothetical protein [Lachnospiraceae bacterium]
MEEKVHGTAKKRMGAPSPVNIPIQMICGMDTTGSITPIRFRFQTNEDIIETIHVEKTVSRDEKNYVGIREKQFICTASVSGIQRIMEIRYNVESQKWRIFQFLA